MAGSTEESYTGSGKGPSMVSDSIQPKRNYTHKWDLQLEVARAVNHRKRPLGTLK
jgi:hypothetical protein